MKVCSKCKQAKVLSEFHKDGRSASGLKSSCKSCRNQNSQDYFQENKVEILKNISNYQKNNADSIKFKHRLYYQKRRKNDTKFRFIHNLKNRIRSAFNFGSKSKSSMTLIGCSSEELKSYLESRFLPGMTWDNYGLKGWHIDHIKPCSSFDLTLPEEQIKCFHYSNLQPLWATDNLKKSDKINY